MARRLLGHLADWLWCVGILAASGAAAAAVVAVFFLLAAVSGG